MRFRVLGSVELVADSGDGGARVLGAPKLRRLLGALLVHANSVVSVDRLADIVWGDDPPANVDGALQSLISRLRTALRSSTTSGHDGVELLTRSPGYLLRVERRHLDATRFEDLVARAGTELEENPGHAATLLDEALQLWRGNPYAEFADEDFARAEAARLEELHLAAEEDRTEAALALGRHDAAIAVLDGFVAEHPLRERPRRQLMLALHRSGRTAEALRCYRDYRERLDEELGLEPSAALQRLELDILRQDETLQAPPISARPAVRVAGGNLPVAVTDLVGRGEELAAVTSALRRARVVTLTGVGGVGKTRLALAAATQAKEDYPDDVWLCELAAVGHPRAVAEAVTTILGVQQRQGLSVVARLVEFLGPKRLLLVLDNCEHVLDAAAGLVDALARGAPGVTVLATSREPLGVEGEHVRPVPPLAVPQPSDSFAPARAGAVPSVALFCERAEAAWPDFALTAENLGAVAEICRRLDGVPLALELAATRVRSMSLEDIAGRLEARFHFLRSGRRIAEERHRTLRAVVDWSYGLLEEPERRVFERLSVFAGDFDLRAAEQVCAPAGDRAQIADRVAALVDKSMVAVQREDGPTRCWRRCGTTGGSG
jgi:predicted ATPase/DNA-binding SARP family transcriptional activator